jgi:hypothetical protein
MDDLCWAYRAASDREVACASGVSHRCGRGRPDIAQEAGHARPVRARQVIYRYSTCQIGSECLIMRESRSYPCDRRVIRGISLSSTDSQTPMLTCPLAVRGSLNPVTVIRQVLGLYDAFAVPGEGVLVPSEPSTCAPGSQSAKPTPGRHARSAGSEPSPAQATANVDVRSAIDICHLRVPNHPEPILAARPAPRRPPAAPAHAAVSATRPRDPHPRPGPL